MVIKICKECSRLVNGDVEKCPDCQGVEFSVLDMASQWVRDMEHDNVQVVQ